MPSIRPDDLSPFGRLALKLDAEFRDLAADAGRMAKLDLESDAGADEGLKILARVAEHGQGLAAAMQQFAASLQEARDQAESATRLVAERAQALQARQGKQDALNERLAKVKDDVQALGATLKPGADKAAVAAELGRVREPMSALVEAARALKAEAAAGKFRRLERQADSVIDSLQASIRKIDAALRA